MAGKKNYILCGAAFILICIGIGVGNFIGKQIAESKKEYKTISSDTLVMDMPIAYGKIVKNIRKSEKLLVISEFDYKKESKSSPSLVRTKPLASLIGTDESTNRKYSVPRMKVFKLVSKDNSAVTISAETENNEVVNLRLKRSEVTFLDEGIWKKVIDSQGNTGWIKEK